MAHIWSGLRGIPFENTPASGMSCCEVLWLWGRRRGPRRLLSRVQCSVFRRCGRCAGSMIPRAHICSGALLACWWHKPCPYVAMMFDVYVWCMCVEAQETQLISRWRRASPRRAAGLSLKVEAVARFCFHMLDMVVTYYEAPHKALEAQRRTRRGTCERRGRPQRGSGGGASYLDSRAG